MVRLSAEWGLAVAISVCLIVSGTDALEDGSKDLAQISGHLAVDTQEHESCETEVRMAKSKCAKRQTQLKDIVGSACGDTHLQTMMKTVTQNHEKTQEQQQQLMDAERMLQMLRTQVTRTYTLEHSAETKLVNNLVVLKSRQHRLDMEEKHAAALSEDERSLLKRANEATDHAVSHARGSDDKTATAGLRDKAADLFEQYVHKRVQMASLKRLASVSKNGVTKLSDEVESKENDAEHAIAIEQKDAEKLLKAERKVDALKTQLAKQEAVTAKSEVEAAKEEKNMLHKKIIITHKTIRTTTKALDASEQKAMSAVDLASAASHMVSETDDMSLKALLAQSQNIADLDGSMPWKE